MCNHSTESPKEYFDEFLLEEGVIPEEYILNAMGDYYQVPAVDVSGFFFETFFLRKFPKDVLHRNAFIPMAVDENIMIVVANVPDDRNCYLSLAIMCHMTFNFVLEFAFTSLMQLANIMIRPTLKYYRMKI